MGQSTLHYINKLGLKWGPQFALLGLLLTLRPWIPWTYDCDSFIQESRSSANLPLNSRKYFLKACYLFQHTYITCNSEHKWRSILQICKDLTKPKHVNQYKSMELLWLWWGLCRHAFTHSGERNGSMSWVWPEIGRGGACAARANVSSHWLYQARFSEPLLLLLNWDRFDYACEC